MNEDQFENYLKEDKLTRFKLRKHMNNMNQQLSDYEKIKKDNLKLQK